LVLWLVKQLEQGMVLQSELPLGWQKVPPLGQQ
jgi:hypothetical protein